MRLPRFARHQKIPELTGHELEELLWFGTRGKHERFRDPTGWTQHLADLIDDPDLWAELVACFDEAIFLEKAMIRLDMDFDLEDPATAAAINFATSKIDEIIADYKGPDPILAAIHSEQ